MSKPYSKMRLTMDFSFATDFQEELMLKVINKELIDGIHSMMKNYHKENEVVSKIETIE